MVLIKPCQIIYRSTPQTTVVVTINTAANNLAFICKKYRISNLLAENGLSNSNSEIYLTVTYFIGKIQANINVVKSLT